MKLIDLKCPACGAEMKVNPDLKRLICVYCGKEMLVDDGVTRLVIENGFDYGYEQEMGRLKAQEDYELEQQKLEAERQTEAERKYREKLEQDQEKRKAEKLKRKAQWKPWFIGAVATGAFGLFMMAFGGFINAFGIIGLILVIVAFCTGYFAYGRIFGQAPTEDEYDVDYIEFPKGMEPFTVLDHGEALTKLKDAGFTNITCRNLHDVKIGLKVQDGKVQSIRVADKVILAGGDWYPKYAPIVISYHGK